MSPFSSPSLARSSSTLDWSRRGPARCVCDGGRSGHLPRPRQRPMGANAPVVCYRRLRCLSHQHNHTASTAGAERTTAKIRRERRSANGESGPRSGCPSAHATHISDHARAQSAMMAVTPSRGPRGRVRRGSYDTIERGTFVSARAPENGTGPVAG